MGKPLPPSTSGPGAGLSSRTIILLSNEAWGPVWFSKHHYANELARLGHRVWFVDPPEPWNPRNVTSVRMRNTPITARLSVLRYQNNLPCLALGSLTSRLNDRLNCWKMARFIGKADNVIFWQFDPARFERLAFFPGCKRILHVVDRYLWPSELGIAETADLVPVLSESYLPRYQAVTTRTMLVPHGISPEDRVADPEQTQALAREHGRFILFVGTVNADVDLGLLEAAATRFRSNRLIVIGPEDTALSGEQRAAFSRLCSLGNVRHLGPVHAKSLPPYVRAAAVCLIPYQTKAASRVQPLKALQYLSHLRPIVTIPLADLRRFEGALVFSAVDHAGFLEHVGAVLGDQCTLETSAAEAYLDTVGYPSLIEKVLRRLDGFVEHPDGVG